MIEQKTIVEQIEVKPDGTVQIRIGLYVVRNGVLGEPKWHRTMIPPGHNLADQMAAVNANLASMGELSVPQSEIDRVAVIIAAVQTPDVLAAYKAKLAAEKAASEMFEKAALKVVADKAAADKATFEAAVAAAVEALKK